MPGVKVYTGGKRTPAATGTNLAIFVLGTANWGPLEATKIESANSFANLYGDPIINSWGYQGIKQIFDEQAKAEVYYGRVVHYTDVKDKDTITASKAEVTVKDRAGVPVDTIKFVAKYYGSKGNRISIDVDDATIDSANKFKVVVKVDGVIKEIYDELSMTDEDVKYVESIINPVSEWIQAVDLDSATVAPNDKPASGTYDLTGGSDGIADLDDADWIGDKDAGNGIYLFDKIKNRRFIIIAPGITSKAVIKAMCEYGLARQVGHCIAMAPYGLSDSEVVDFKNSTGSYTGTDSIKFKNLSLYHPWIIGKRAYDNLTTYIPAEGAQAANYSKTDARRGVAKPAAGLEDGHISKVTAIGVAAEVNDDYLNENGICAIKVFENYGVVSWGARSTSDDPDFAQFQVSRTIQYFTQWCFDNLMVYVFEPPNSSTYDKISLDGEAELMSKYRAGWFDDGGTDDPAEAFFFQCDASNNPKEVREAKKIRVDFGVRPNGATEIIECYLDLYKGTVV